MMLDSWNYALIGHTALVPKYKFTLEIKFILNYKTLIFVVLYICPYFTKIYPYLYFRK